jgi:hypothetical protein
MRESRTGMNTFGTRRALLRLRQLLDSFRMLVGWSPDLRDAFDPDELPLTFILERDSRVVRRSSARKLVSRPALVSISRRAMPSPLNERRLRRKQFPDS